MTYDEYCTALSERASDQSATASEVARKLAFVAGAACWIFRNEDFQFPTLILIAFGMLCGFFVLDLAQYVTSWRLSVRLLDLVSGDLPPGAEAAVDRRNRQKLDRIFLAKMVALLLVYLAIALEVLSRFSPQLF